MYYMLSMIYTRGIIIQTKKKCCCCYDGGMMPQNSTIYDFNNDGLEWCECAVCAVWNL